MAGAPALQDLADLNVAHWQSQSDQRNILHVARVPILFGAGIPDDVEGQPGFKVSAGSFTRATDPAAKLMFVEHSGAAIGAGDADLKNLEFQMQAMGLQLSSRSRAARPQPALSRMTSRRTAPSP
jgi:hypothetical protein